eukprot:gene16890-22378_t
MYSLLIADIISKVTKAKVYILGDVTYGACCIDDYSCFKLGVELLIHYGHSCLISTQYTKIKVMYVFVEIYFDNSHLVNVISNNFKHDERLALMGTIQFSSTIYDTFNQLKELKYNSLIPQSKPLSPGETLGCTSAVLPSECSVIIFIADGRFHMEAAMIQNPNIKMFKYDPYSKVLSSEGYDIELMKSIRQREIEKAKHANTFGLILGTLGRQGSSHIFNRLRKIAFERGKKIIPFLMAEINPLKLELINEIDVWIQVACPRLSIDWGGNLKKPLLTPYEFEVAINEVEWKDIYPMDHYRNDAGSWGTYTALKENIN